MSPNKINVFANQSRFLGLAMTTNSATSMASVFRGYIHASLFMLLVILTTSTQAWADASAFASGSGNKWGWATDNSQQEANRRALTSCNELTPEKDCKLNFTKAVVRAKGGGKIGMSRSSIGLADAKKRAIESCGNANCKVEWVVTTPGLYSLYESDNDEKGNGNFYLAHGVANLDDAGKSAKEGCEKLAGQKCQPLWAGAIAGFYNLATASKPKPSPQVDEKNCRPKTNSIRCTSQCYNGNCIVNYENGCKIRVQVQAKYNAFTSQWEYPSPGC